MMKLKSPVAKPAPAAPPKPAPDMKKDFKQRQGMISAAGNKASTTNISEK